MNEMSPLHSIIYDLTPEANLTSIKSYRATRWVSIGNRTPHKHRAVYGRDHSRQRPHSGSSRTSDSA